MVNIAANVVGLGLGTAARFWAIRRWIFLSPRRLKKREDREATHRRALAIWEKLAKEFPTVPEYRQGVARFPAALDVVSRTVGNLHDDPGDQRRPAVDADSHTLDEGTANFGPGGGLGGMNFNDILSQLKSMMEPHEGPLNWKVVDDLARDDFAALPEWLALEAA